MGCIYLYHNNLSKAEEYFKLAIKNKLNPYVTHRDWPYIFLGKIYAMRGKYKEAEGYFLKGVSMLGSTPALTETANFYYNRGELEKAREYYLRVERKALDVHNPGGTVALVYAYFSLGQISIKEGRKKEAREYFRKVVESRFPYFLESSIPSLKKEAKEAIKQLDN